MRARTVIVGGGVVGISIALHAARRSDPLKEPVMLLESKTIGEGSDSLSGAVLSQYFATRDAGGMARDSLRYYRGIEERTARSLGYLASGALTLPTGSSEADRTRLRQTVEMLGTLGVEIDIVEAARIRELFPGIQIEDGAIGAWEPSAGCLDPNRALNAMTTLARNRGAVIREGTGVDRLIVEEGRVVGVETSDGRIDCDDVVIASGSGTRKLLAPLGVDLPIEFVRAEYCYMGSTVEQPDEAALESSMVTAGPEASGATGWYPGGFVRQAEADGDHPDSFAQESQALRIAHPVLTDPDKGFYIRCDPLNSRVTVGRRGEASFRTVDDPDTFDPSVSQEFLAWARGVVAERLPEYADVHELGAETRLFTRMPDGEPLLGSVASLPGLHVACALSTQGFTLAPSVGEGIAQMILGEPNSAFEAEPYSPMRYL